MDYRNNNQTDPWDEGVFGTGNTMPPRSHSGIIALLLILVIFLSGIVSVLSFLNIRLFQQLTIHQQELQQNQTPMSFSDQHTEATEVMQTPPQMLTPSRKDITLRLDVPPETQELSLQEIFEKNRASVVSIFSSTSTGTTIGSGVVLSPQGYIITTCQVIDDAETITVSLTDGRSFSAIVIGADKVTDLAVVYVDAQDLVPARFGDSASVRVGDPVTVMGDILGTELSGSLSTGIISALHQDLPVLGQTVSLIQTNAPVLPGYAGGPLLNSFGQVVGICSGSSRTFTQREEAQDLGLVIPTGQMKPIVEQLIAQGYVSGRPTLGIRGETISQFDRYYFKIPAGLYITQVDPDSDAGSQGIEPGDILISLDGQPISCQSELDTLVLSMTIGHRVTALIYRNGQEVTLTLTLTEYEG